MRLPLRASSEATTKSSANRTSWHDPHSRGFASRSSHASSTWCRKTFESIGLMTPP